MIMNGKWLVLEGELHIIFLQKLIETVRETS
jgi:hypothetical protein